jgi:glycosyltransferase 2 family protein
MGSQKRAMRMRGAMSPVEDRHTMDIERRIRHDSGPQLDAARPTKGVRFFSAPREAQRARRATDVIIGMTATLALIGVALAAKPPAAFEQALINLFDALPHALEVIWQAGWGLLVAWVLLVPVIGLIRRRVGLFRDLVVAVVLAAALASTVGMIVSPSWPGVLDAVGSSGPPAVIPALRLASAVAVISTSSPHLSRPFRHLGRWLIVLGAFSGMVLGVTTPSGATAAVLVGLIASSIVHLVFGSTAGRPGIGDVRGALSELGIPVADLEPAERQTAGVYVLHGTTTGGAAIDIKVYGRDAWDTQLLARLWRAMWYRELGPAMTLTRLQQAEHEAFVTLLAARQGVSVPEVVTAGTTQQQDALLVLRHTPGSAVDDPQLDSTATLARLWDELAKLHRADMVHGDISPSVLRVTDDGPVIADLSTAQLAPTDDDLGCDRAQLLVTTALLAPRDQALAAALDHLGAKSLAAAVSFVQPPALGGNLRRRVDAADLDLDELRSAASELAGVQAPELAQLRRVTLGGLLRAGLLTFAAYALISALGDLNLADLADQLKNAEWGWLILALFLAQTPRLAQAVATLGASTVALPYGPVTALQFAISFVNLAIPSTAARIAVNVRFFQRQGVRPATAVSIGVLDGFSGFIVQLMILVGVLVLGIGTVDLDIDPSRSESFGNLVLLVVGMAAAAVIVVLAVPVLRRNTIAALRRWVGEALRVARGLRSPRRIARLIGGNLASELLFASTLGICCWAFGVSVPLGTILTINVVTSLFAGLMPIPGGIGVTEGALIAGLTAAGVPSDTAFAIVICYRLVTFYLPPIWGAFAFRWLERNAYL